MLKRPKGPPGRIVRLEHVSKVLKGNPLGDPHVRDLCAWLPPQHDDPDHAADRFPVLYDLTGFLGAGPAHLNWRGFAENLAERCARLVNEGKMAPAIVVFPDCFTALGGNQYVNSSAIGRYEDYLVDELVPFVDTQFRTLASRDHRGVFGKSSGGYGSIVHAMRHPDVWGAAADHSGDAYFDFVYGSDWPSTLDTLARHAKPKRVEGAIDVAARARDTGKGRDDGRVAAFLKSVHGKHKMSMAEGHAIMMVCMAATYDPDPKAPNGFRLPYDLETGERLEKRWAQWLKHDPIHLVERHAAALRSLHGLWIDCGWADQYHIHYGARILSRRLAEHRVEHVYEEFDDNHSDIDYRMDRSLPFLVERLSARGGDTRAKAKPARRGARH